MRGRQLRALRADMDRALHLHRGGRLDEAAGIYRKILQAMPDQADALQLLGAVEGQQGRHEQAVELLRRAVESAPDNAAAHNNLGNALAQLQHHGEALACFDRSLLLKPDNPKALRNRGNALRKLNRLDEALRDIDHVLALTPGSLEATVDRGELMVALGRFDEAIECFRSALPGGKDVAALRFVLASLGAEDMPDQAPTDYVKGLFDQYATKFDKHLLDVLGYRTPPLLVDAMRPVLPAAPGEVVDLGCGTGLCGPLLRPLARRLVGVDLSEAMLERARDTGHYDALEAAELVAWLRATAERFDIAFACDVLIYLGDMAPAFAAVQAVLREGGLFAFSVERSDGDEIVLQPTRRYAHSHAYLERQAAEHGFVPVSIGESVLRQDGNQPVHGWLVVLQRA